MSPLLPISPGDPALDLVAAAEALADAGCDSLLLREPGRGAAELARLAERALRWLPGLIVHDRCPGGRELTRTLGLGLHLPAAAPRIPGAVGQSAHDAAELSACAGLRYALLSPVWPPSSKPGDRRPPLLPRAFLALAASAPVPVYALGGLTPARARELGHAFVAVQGWLFSDPSPSQIATRAGQLLAELRAVPS